MLEKTFVHVQGVGYSTERRLWQQGADCWRSFLAEPTTFHVPRPRLPGLLDTVSQSPGALARGDHRFFRQRLPTRDHWRALPAFAGRVAYLDIETDGGTDFDNVTVIGVYDGRELRQFVRGEDLLDFPEAIEETAILVTFFGAGFDLPVLRRVFPRVRFDQLHLDLCPALRRLGYSGGLKRIERQLGIARSPETAALSGWDAVRLWRECRWGSAEARRILLAYNAEDVMNMVPLAGIAYRGLVERMESGYSVTGAQADSVTGAQAERVESGYSVTGAQAERVGSGYSVTGAQAERVGSGYSVTGAQAERVESGYSVTGARVESGYSVTGSPPSDGLGE